MAVPIRRSDQQVRAQDRRLLGVKTESTKQPSLCVKLRQYLVREGTRHHELNCRPWLLTCLRPLAQDSDKCWRQHHRLKLSAQ